jgi:hypothetical protein
VGRIEVEGMVLVDLGEAISLLGKSRATVFRLLKNSELIKIDVGGTKTLYITLESIERYKNHGPQFELKELEPDSVRSRRRRELEKRFPNLFKSRPSPPGKHRAVHGRLSSRAK